MKQYVQGLLTFVAFRALAVSFSYNFQCVKNYYGLNFKELINVSELEKPLKQISPMTLLSVFQLSVTIG